MNNEIRLSLSEARERDDADVNWRKRAIADQVAPANEPYTPPAPVAAWLAKYDTEKPPTRNYAAILEAAKRKPVGYWADAPRGIQFGGGGGPVSPPAPGSGNSPDAATPSDDPYEPVGTVPVVGDVVQLSKIYEGSPVTTTITGLGNSGHFKGAHGWEPCKRYFITGKSRVLKRKGAPHASR